MLLGPEVRRTAKGYHIYFTLEHKLSDPEIIALQAIMGSDYRREMFNWLRTANGNWEKYKEKNLEWNVMFSSKKRIINGRFKEVSREVFDPVRTEQLKRSL